MVKKKKTIKAPFSLSRRQRPKIRQEKAVAGAKRYKAIRSRKKVCPKKKISLKFERGALLLGLSLGALILGLAILLGFEKEYQEKVYPGVKILGVDFGGKKKQEVESLFKRKNFPFENLNIVFSYQDKVATLSGKQINLGFDSRLSAEQAFLVGRGGSFLSRSLIKFQALTSGVELNPHFKWEKKLLKETLDSLAKEIKIPPQNSLFNFENGKVVAFRLSKKGRRLNAQKTLADLETKFAELTKKTSFPSELKIPLQVEVVEPKVTTTQANDLGIEALLGKRSSYFAGSAQERIHNIALSSSRLHGLLIAPGEIFSLNNALGDISAVTGYKSAYIIKDGKTVLGDGGGVCQTSSTLFRAALNAGLEILERHPHSYRVSYYEQGGFSPGIDATVFAPNVDLKIKNNTPTYILIQTKLDYTNVSLTFEFYGKRDGRQIEISNVKIWDQKPPPEDKYIDDPTLPKGGVKQVEWKAWGAKTSFSYKVTKNGEVLEEETFFSNFLPWQAVYLRGTQE